MFNKRPSRFRDQSGRISTYDANHVWASWRRSEDAGCLRKLWNYGATLCKAELDDVASGSGTGEKIKFTSSAAAELEQKAVAAGMEAPVSDVERPSLWTLQKVANNHALGGKLVHLEWEAYVSMEAEERLGRSGKALKKRPAVFLVGGKTLEIQEQELELEGVVRVTGLVTLREVLSLRARAMSMLELLPYAHREEQSQAGADVEEDKRARKCLVCGKRHEPRCTIPEGFRKELKAKAKAAKAAGKGKKGDKSKKGDGSGGKGEGRPAAE